jgi:hypothetical protein
MAEKKPDHLQDVSKMTFEQRYKKIQEDHKKRQAVTVAPHDLRVQDINKQTGKL